MQASALPHFLDPQYSGWGVPDLARVPGGQSFSLGLSSADGVERVVANPYLFATRPGWPWLPNQPAPRFY
jgi:hypothetical protein